MRDNKVKVLYIAGWGRSGSTILGNILGQIDGFFSGGELRSIWDQSFVENRLCGCGVPLEECEIWRSVLDEVFGGLDQPSFHRIISVHEQARTRHLPFMLTPWGEKLLERRLEKYLDYLDNLYKAVQSTTGSKVIIDSSKFPSYGYILGILPSVDLYIVHLIRDPRGVAYSWLRRKRLLDSRYPAYMDRYNPIKSSIMWDVWNLTIESIWGQSLHRYIRIRYEDFVHKPKKTLQHILDLLQEDSVHPPFIDDQRVVLDVNHTLSGNPNRLQSGTVNLQPDEEWQKNMKWSDKFLVTMLTWPLLIRYRYLQKSNK